MADDKADLDKFLSQVDEINAVIKGLNTDDETTQQDAMVRADDLLKSVKASTNVQKTAKKKYAPLDTTGINKTSINQKAFDEMGKEKDPAFRSETMSQEAFMSVMEQDAKERHERKRQQKEEATKLKDEGNIEFNAGNYKKAVDLYTQALGVFKDMTALWTNRAQAYIKLQQYEKAIEDCDWALRVFENCLKAYIHKGKAHHCLKQYDQSVECFQRALQIEPSKEKIIQEYITDVERSRTADLEEAEAKQLFDSGDTEVVGLVGLIEKVNREDQLPPYYTGGLRVIESLLTNTSERTLFRTQGGLSLTQTHPHIAKCFSSSPKSLSREQLEVCCATFDCLKAACIDNEENCRRLVEVKDFASQVLTFFEAKQKRLRRVNQSCISLLHAVGQTEAGREAITQSFDLTRLLTCIFEFLKTNPACALSAVRLLNNLALDKRFKSQMRTSCEETILPAFERLMIEDCSEPAVLPCCISTVTNLAGDTAIRKKMMARQEMWQVTCQTLVTYNGRMNRQYSVDVLVSCLGLLVNLTVETSEHMLSHAVCLTSACLPLTKLHVEHPDLCQRSLAVLSRLLPASEEAVSCAVKKSLVTELVLLLKLDGDVYTKSATRCLTACTQSSDVARQQVIDNKGLGTLVSLLKHKEESVFGNAALCLSHMVALPNISAKLTKTNVIQHLLVLARDGLKPQVQHNCAILIAKLTQSDPKHLERLRELHGIEILYDVMKHVKE